MSAVSIVTCTYNRAHLIGETIQSVLQQTFQDFEYIIVDDGSVDNTKEIVESFHDDRIHYFYHERTGGHLSKLRNYAHTKCKGDFVAYIDSDDLWLEDKLQKQISFLNQNSNVGFSFTDIEVFNKEGIIKKSIYNNKKGEFTGSVFQEMLQNKLVICHTTLVIRKNCLEKTGPMDESMHSGDHDLVFLLSRLYQAHIIFDSLVRVRKHDQNSTSDSKLTLKLLEEHHYSLEKLLHKKLITNSEYRCAVAKSSYSFGVQLQQANEHTPAASYFLKGLKTRPWNLKGWVRWVISLTKQKFGF